MKPGDEIWITKDERLILVREMDDQHLLNTHRLVSKNGRSAKDLIGFGFGPFAPRGEIASEDYDKACDRAFETLIACKFWEGVFRIELNKRNLRPLELPQETSYMERCREG